MRWSVALGDDDFTLVRKTWRDVQNLQRRAAQLATQNERYEYVYRALMDFKEQLVRAAREMGREGDL